MTRGALAGVVLLAVWSGACSEENQTGPTGKLAGASACENYAALASNHDCEPPETCSVSTECEEEAEAFIQCAATDDAQCSCEKSGDLNCEGAWKPNEGPARCIAEHDALEACEG